MVSFFLWVSVPQLIYHLYTGSVSWSKFDAKGKTWGRKLSLWLGYHSLSVAMCSSINCS